MLNPDFNVNSCLRHGSVGSLGKYKNEEKVDLIRVSNCTINGTQNGVRVKTWPGAPPSEASNMIFENIVMTNVTSPIIIDQEYCPSQQCDIQKVHKQKAKQFIQERALYFLIHIP